MTPINWEVAPHTGWRKGMISDFFKHRLYVSRASKGSRWFVGVIDGERVGTWDNRDMAMSQTAKIARESFES